MRDFKQILHQSPWENHFRLADFFHENSSLDRFTEEEAIEVIEDFVAEQSANSCEEVLYPHSQKIQLPPHCFDGLSRARLLEAIFARRSRRKYEDRKLTLKELSALLTVSYGMSGNDLPGCSTIPSAGGLFPLHVYLISLGTELPNGVFHYYFRSPVLDMIWLKKDEDAWDLSFIQSYNLDNSPALFLVITGSLRKTCAKYGDRGYRFALLEAGHLAQNLMLLGEALHLKSVALGAFFDRALADFLHLDFLDEKPLYILGLGA